MRKLLARALLVPTLFVVGTALLWAQHDSTTSSRVPADNTKVNQRDRNANEPTADQQKENTLTGSSRRKSGGQS